MIVHEFSISYFSEVSAIIKVTNDCELTATHSSDNVGIDCWFHFNGTPPGVDPLVVDGDNPATIVAEMADRLYPGAEHILELDDDVDDIRTQFFTDFMIALATGGYHYQSRDGPRNYTHPAGEWLEALS